MIPDLIISIHIAKTGGFTFGNMLKKVYGKSFVWLTQSSSAKDAFDQLKELDWHKVKCFHSHTAYGLHEYIPKDINYGYVIFLRNPIERLLSTYHFLKMAGYLKDHSNSVSWIKGRSWATLDNGMTRILNGNLPITVALPGKYKVSRRDYRLALEHLKSFFFVGITCTYESSIKQLAKILDWNKIPMVEREMWYPDRIHQSDLSWKEQKSLMNMQRHDFNLWNEAKKLNLGFLESES